MRRWLLLVALALVLTSAAAQSPVTHELRVTGEVERQLVLTLEGVRGIAVRRGMAQADGYAGVRLVDLLEEADIRRDAPRALRRTYVVAEASDGYQAVFSWGELFNTSGGRKVLVAIEREGKELRDGEGRFALISPADERPGPRHVKWLRQIDVRRIPEAAR